MHDAPLVPGQPSYRSAIIGGWQLLRQQFKSLAGALIIFMILLMIGFIADGILGAISPGNADLWRFPMYLWIYVISIGFYHLLAKVIAGQDWATGDLLWGIGRAEAWVLSLLPAALASILMAFSGLSVTPGHPLPPDIFTRPDFWIGMLVSTLIGTFFGYVFMLYAAYGATPKSALKSALHIFSNRLAWLFFPYVITLIMMLALVITAIPVGLFLGLIGFLLKLLAVPLVAKFVVGVAFLVIFVVLIMAMLIWVYGSLIIASGALAEPEGQEGRLIT